MGIVYRARHRVTGAVRALKVLSGPVDVESAVRFRREVEALARVGGAGIVPIHEAGEQDGRLYFVMALMPGGSLAGRLRAAGRLEWRAAATLVAGLARALERCHRAGLVHRDLKPANVLFDEEGRASIADFGCARDAAATSLTETGVAIGTPAYMAPEQLEAGRSDARTDVYALGIILSELVTGTTPFEGGSPVAMLRERLAGRRRPLGPEHAPPALDEVVARALAPRPEHRPSAEAFAADLEWVLAGVPPKPSPPRRGGRLTPARAMLPIAAVAIAVAIAVAERRRASSTGTSADVAPAASASVGPVRSETLARVDVRERLAAASASLAAGRPLASVEASVDEALAAGTPLPADAVATLVSALEARVEKDCARVDLNRPRAAGIRSAVHAFAIQRKLAPKCRVADALAMAVNLTVTRAPGSELLVLLDALEPALESCPEVAGELARALDRSLDEPFTVKERLRLRAVLERAVDRALPQDASFVRMVRGDFLLREGDILESEAPGDARAVALYRLAATDLESAHGERTLLEEKDFVAATARLAYVSERLGGGDRALELYREAARVGAGMLSTRYVRRYAAVCVEKGLRAEAIACLDRGAASIVAPEPRTELQKFAALARSDMSDADLLERLR